MCLFCILLERGVFVNYDALRIAQYIIDYCNKKGISISHLKLQKLLYFVWIHYYKQTGEILFDDNFSAWQLGPVVSEVYYSYCIFGGRPINREYDVHLESSDKDIIDKFLKSYAHFSARYLVDKSHINGGAWDFVFGNGIGENNTIPQEIIIDLECK